LGTLAASGDDDSDDSDPAESGAPRTGGKDSVSLRGSARVRGGMGDEGSGNTSAHDSESGHASGDPSCVGAVAERYSNDARRQGCADVDSSREARIGSAGGDSTSRPDSERYVSSVQSRDSGDHGRGPDGGSRMDLRGLLRRRDPAEAGQHGSGDSRGRRIERHPDGDGDSSRNAGPSVGHDGERASTHGARDPSIPVDVRVAGIGTVPEPGMPIEHDATREQSAVSDQFRSASSGRSPSGGGTRILSDAQSGDAVGRDDGGKEQICCSDLRRGRGTGNVSDVDADTDRGAENLQDAERGSGIDRGDDRSPDSRSQGSPTSGDRHASVGDVGSESRSE